MVNCHRAFKVLCKVELNVSWICLQCKTFGYPTRACSSHVAVCSCTIEETYRALISSHRIFASLVKVTKHLSVFYFLAVLYSFSLPMFLFCIRLGHGHKLIAVILCKLFIHDYIDFLCFQSSILRNCTRLLCFEGT